MEILDLSEGRAEGGGGGRLEAIGRGGGILQKWKRLETGPVGWHFHINPTFQNHP